MIDLHVHLLPAIDDGAASIEVARAMLAKCKALGFTRLVATPHLAEALSPRYEELTQAALHLVRAISVELDIGVESGFEILLSPDLPFRLQQGERSTLAGSSTVLVELPFAGWPLYAEQTLYDLQTLGYRPLLAHPERYAALHAEPSRALDLAERGVMLQVTFGSLVGLFGKPAQRVAELLLREGAVNVLASDAHSAGQRYACIEEGLTRAEALVGPHRLRQLVLDNPLALLENQPLPSPAEALAMQPELNGWRKAFQRAASRVRA